MKTKWTQIVVSLTVTVAASQLAYADNNCAKPNQVTYKTWTKLKRALPIADELIEGSYYGQGHTTQTSYELHLIQYLGARDTFVAVMQNREKESGAIGILRRQQGTYLWHGIRATPGAVSQLEPVFEGRP